MEFAGKYSPYVEEFSAGREKQKLGLSSTRQANKLPSLSSSFGAEPLSYTSSAWRVMEQAGGGRTQYT